MEAQTKYLPRGARQQLLAVKKMAIETTDITIMIDQLKNKTVVGSGTVELDAAIMHLQIAKSKLQAYNSKVSDCIKQISN